MSGEPTDGGPGGPVARRLPASTPQDPGRTFVGRVRELEALTASLRRSITGGARIALLAGEPGIGKTRTAQQLAAQATASDVLTLWGRCLEEPGAPPYWPWLQLIRRYVDGHDAAVWREVVGAAAAQFAALDPDLAQRLGEPGLPPDAADATDEADAAKARFRLFDAIAGFWRRAAARQPLLLVIDDLHRADVPSLRLLEFVMVEAAESRLMLLGTYRDAEVVRQHPLSDTLAELGRHVSVQRLLIGGFTPAETAEFVAGATGATSAHLAAMLHEQTDGHPLYLAELAHEMRLSPGAEPGRAGLAPLRIQKGVREVIGARLNRLSRSGVGALQGAAVIGRTFRVDLLRRLLDELSAPEFEAAIDEARAASLIVGTGEAGHEQFTHALVRDALYDELSASDRQRWHGRIGEALESLYEGDLTPCLSALAHHHHAAGPQGDVAKATRFATRAAERATALQAHEEAARHYRRAGEALASTPGADAERCRLQLGLGHAQNSAGASALALATFEAAFAAARRLDDASLMARAAIGFGDAQWRLGIEGTKAVELISEALAHPAGADVHERVALLSAVCQALLFANRPDEAEKAFREAVAIARDLGDTRVLFRSLCAILPGRWFPDRLALRIAVAREAIELVGRAGRPDWVVPYLSGWHTGDLMESGDTTGATATAKLHLAIGSTKREPFNEAVALAALAMIATHEGRFADAEPLALQAMQCGTRFDRGNAAGIFGVQMFTLRRHQGRLGEMAPMLKTFLASESSGTIWAPGLAVLHAELGDLDAARACFDRLAAGGFDGLARDAVRIASVAYLAEVCACLADTAAAPRLVELLMPYRGRNIVFGAHTASFGAADRLLGLLAATLQRWEDAERHFEQAIAFDERTGGRPWLARSQHAFAVMLGRRGGPGDAERARALLVDARAAARKLGMRSLEDEVIALQEGASGRAPTTAVAGLSAREVQVLRLVAAGKTNQEIAATLFRSPNTVANHVRSILGKTQAANRAEASAFAVRHGLTTPD